MRYCFVLGTRPELIKMAPVIKIFKEKKLETTIISTSQHKELLSTANKIFKIQFDIDLNIMKNNQDLFDISIDVLSKIKEVFIKLKPDYVFVQGDTTTAFIVALSAFYQNLKICHIEAGLRSFDKHQPFPEEINRKLISVVSDYHFCPTELSAKNLKKESIKNNVYVVGNTVVDALLSIDSLINTVNVESLFEVKKDNYILVEVHRRESFGKTMEEIMLAINEIQKISNMPIIFPVHYNPNVRNLAYSLLSHNKNIKLIEPVDYLTMLSLIKNAKLIITDSGGIQEEAPTFKTPVIVVRNKTERPEGLKDKFIILASTNKKQIIKKITKYLNHKQTLLKLNIPNPYGDGKASERILNIITQNQYSPFINKPNVQIY